MHVEDMKILLRHCPCVAVSLSGNMSEQSVTFAQTYKLYMY